MKPTTRLARHGLTMSMALLLAVIAALCLLPLVRIPVRLRWAVSTQQPTIAHLRAPPPMPPLEGDRVQLTTPYFLDGDKTLRATTSFFAQHGESQRGVHYALENTALLDDAAHMEKDALLVVAVVDSSSALGARERSAQFFELLGSFSHPANKTSVTILTTGQNDFREVQKTMRAKINHYAQLSLLFRNDFGSSPYKLARYRNFALLSTLAKWHQHVVWLDAHVHAVPSDLVAKMIRADRDILEPSCFLGKPPSTAECEQATSMSNFRKSSKQFVPLDSVGDAMLYVRADVHRQGVLFANHYGKARNRDGYGVVEPEGLCYNAQMLGYRCWGMPHDNIYQVDRRPSEENSSEDLNIE